MNIGVAILRIIACFMVVSIHFGGTLPGSNAAVPIFVFLAFYFMDRTLDWGILLKREKRILLPYLVWSLVGCLVAGFMPWFGGWRDCFKQFVFGAPCNSPLYFMNDLMWMTAVVFVVRYYHRRHSWLVLGGLAIGSLIVQYTGFNNTMWKWLPPQGEILFGRLLELLPVAILGMAFSHAHHAGRRYVVIAASVTLVLLGACTVFNILPYEMGYAYGGLPKVLGASLICMIAIIAGDFAPPPMELAEFGNYNRIWTYGRDLLYSRPAWKRYTPTDICPVGCNADPDCFFLGHVADVYSETLEAFKHFR